MVCLKSKGRGSYRDFLPEELWTTTRFFSGPKRLFENHIKIAFMKSGFFLFAKKHQEDQIRKPEFKTLEIMFFVKLKVLSL